MAHHTCLAVVHVDFVLTLPILIFTLVALTCTATNLQSGESLPT